MPKPLLHRLQVMDLVLYCPLVFLNNNQVLMVLLKECSNSNVQVLFSLPRPLIKVDLQLHLGDPREQLLEAPLLRQSTHLHFLNIVCHKLSLTSMLLSSFNCLFQQLVIEATFLTTFDLYMKSFLKI